MKKIFTSTLLLAGLTFGVIGNNAEAVGTQTNMNPTKLSTTNLKPQTITISTNYGGPSAFYFNPGDGSPVKQGNDIYSRSFSHTWSTKSISTYTYSGRVVNQDYGPGPTVYGTAHITY
ncbi:hypothetical protein ACQKCU_26465 [Heyndrickxia sporothermodurans]